MTFFPIFIPAGDETEYIFPGWVDGLITIALISIIIGMVALLACFTADIVFDRPVPDKWEGLALLVLICGFALSIITLPIMILTGLPVE
jgi:hypothetical protein